MSQWDKQYGCFFNGELDVNGIFQETEIYECEFS